MARLSWQETWYHDIPPLMGVLCFLLAIPTLIVSWSTNASVQTSEYELFDMATLPLKMSERPRQINSISLSGDKQSLVLGVRGIMLYNSTYAEVSTEFDTLFHVCIEGGGCLNPGVYASVDEENENMQETIELFTPNNTNTDRRRLLRIYFGRRGSKKRWYFCILCKLAGCQRDWGKTSCVRILALGLDVDKK